MPNSIRPSQSELIGIVAREGPAQRAEFATAQARRKAADLKEGLGHAESEQKCPANPWAIAAGGDFAFAETTGDKPPATDAINRYVRRVGIAAQHDEKVARAMFEVQGLLAPPPSLMKPAMMLRVLRVARRWPTGTSASTPAASPAIT